LLQCTSCTLGLLLVSRMVSWANTYISNETSKSDRVNTPNFPGLKTVAGESAVNAAHYRNYRNNCHPVQLGGERRKSARYKQERFLMTTFVFWT
jgi:hypothetical protein